MLTPYSSLRAVEVTSADGQARRYDVYRALHEGGIDQDPFVRPGDGIAILRRGSEVSLEGEVARPGKYQVLAGEGLDAVVRRYGGGLTSAADAERVKVTRRTRGQLQSFQVDLGDAAAPSFPLEDGDVIAVPPLTDRLPMVVFEGAVTGGAAPADIVVTGETDQISAEPYTRLIHRFTPGDTLYQALLKISASISPSANLAKSYIVRKVSAQVIPVDLEAMYFSHSRVGDLSLQPSDRIVIPFYRYYVSVVGAVDSPGRYQYVPLKTLSYYVSLAGGIPLGATPRNVSITDSNGNPVPLDAAIEPEDRIIVTEERIAVAGGVYVPGSYGYVPGRTAPYYLGLAGGIDPELNSDDSLSVLDAEGNPKGRSEPVQPGDRIFVHKNDFQYGFNRYFPVITSALTLVTSMITLITVLSN
jgi:protein involved in polysaccharide export with SLBB domain